MFTRLILTALIVTGLSMVTTYVDMGFDDGDDAVLIASNLIEDSPAAPVPAWYAFCDHYPAECRVDPHEPTTVRLTREVWTALNTVNAAVNAEIEPITDQEHWGVADRWDLAEDGGGDCEDIQLLKRKRLVALGIPRRAMRMTVVLDEKGEGHAVLAILTTRGAFILDNLTDHILAWGATGYTYVKREGSVEGTWINLRNEPVAHTAT